MRWRSRYGVWVVGLLSLALTCQKDPVRPPEDSTVRELNPGDYPVGLAQCGGGEGTLEVTLYAPSGNYPIPGAVVYSQEADCGVTTNAQGRATLQGLGAGIHTLVIQAGIFQNVVNQEVGAGVQDVALRLEQGDVKLAVFAGGYDNVEYILDSLGFGYDFFTSTDSLLSGEFYNRYDMILVNCGAAHLQDTSTYVNLMQEYVRSGGRVYISDQAIPFFANLPFDEEVRLLVETDPYGGWGMNTAAWAVDSLLRSAVGLDTFTVEFLGSWVMLDTVVAPGAHVLVEGDAHPEPSITLVLPFSQEIPYGEGKVFITSFHLEGSSPAEVQRFLQHLVLRY